jgi:hypothetical protein
VPRDNKARHKRLAVARIQAHTHSADNLRFERSSAMERQSSKRTLPFSERCLQEAARLRAEAKNLQPGPERNALIKKARQADTAAHIDEWLRSPGLQPPR